MNELRNQYVRILLAKGFTAQQADNVAGACAAYGMLEDAIKVALGQPKGVGNTLGYGGRLMDGGY